MTTNIESGFVPADEGGVLRNTRNLSRWLVIAALFAVAFALRHVVVANTDVSWLLTAGERLLDGQRLYQEIIETNPPMAVLTYIPGILLARTLGLPAEIVIDGLVFAAMAGSLAMVARILESSTVGDDVPLWPLGYLAVAVLAIMPTEAFGQREHIAVIELMPALAVLAVRMNRHSPPLWAVVCAGLGLGLSLSFKPHFAIAILCSLGSLALYLKSWRILLTPEYLIAAAFCAVYLACIAFAFPDYFTIIVPLARDVYVPFRLSAIELLQNPTVLPWATALIAAYLMTIRRGLDASFVLLLSMSIGFAVVFFVQRKGWPYHSYPMMVFALLALGYAIRPFGERADRDRLAATGATLLLAVLFVQSMVWFNRAFDTGSLQDAVARYGPHPKILAVTGEPGVGHPLTRAVGGVWVSRQQALWVTGYTRLLQKRGSLDAGTAAMMDNYAARERDWLIADIRKREPTLVLVDHFTDDWRAWIAADPQVAALLKPYSVKQTIDGIDILSKPE